jgi:ADP-ribose pyrophosphatase YjhB (NUDIX family)
MTFAFNFCPRCGAPLTDGIAFGRTHRLCRHCGFIQFRDPKVAVGAIVTNGLQVLLVRRSAEPRVGFWALPAGYMDADEAPEEALLREIAEEAGLAIRVMELAGIVPLAGWRERRGIMLVYRAEPVGGQLLAGDDVSEARWFGAADIPWDQIAFESTTEFLRAWASDLG